MWIWERIRSVEVDLLCAMVAIVSLAVWGVLRRGC
jgi:hypothetical protein